MVMLLGGYNNELTSPFFAVVDGSRPSGTSPAVRAKYRCRDCGSVAADPYLVLPTVAIDGLYGSQPYVERIEPDFSGKIVVSVAHSVEGKHGAIFHHFDTDFRLVENELSKEFEALYLELAARHRLPPIERADDLQVRRWDGRAFAVLPAGGR